MSPAAANYVDIYTVTPTALVHRGSRSLVPCNLRSDASGFRGDTLRLRPPTAGSPRPTHLFATTRGGVRGVRGWLVVFALDEDGLFVGGGDSYDSIEISEAGEVGVDRWETPTSGGRANAIELRAKDESGDDGVWIVLTDDEELEGDGPVAAVRVLEWDSVYGVRSVVEWPSGENAETENLTLVEGASHAIWLD